MDPVISPLPARADPPLATTGGADPAASPTVTTTIGGLPGICCGGDSGVAEDGITCDFLLKLLRAGSMVGADAALLQELESRASALEAGLRPTDFEEISPAPCLPATDVLDSPSHGSTPDKHMDFVGLLCCNTSLPNIYVASTSILEVEAVDKHYQQQKQDVSSRKQRCT
uniref:Uncharacterized protein n=1 Tax=Oryza glumipatula TaxID=40148 RepID=A0A0D9YTG2_9ORYZ